MAPAGRADAAVRPPWASRPALAITAAAILLIAVAVPAAWVGVPALPLPSAVLDLTVGVALGLTGLLSPVATAQRLVVAATGGAWLLATSVPTVPTLHQGFLVLALAWFPDGAPRSVPRAALGTLAVPVVLGLGGQLLAGGALAAAGVAALMGHGVLGGAARWLPALTGLVLGGGLMLVGVLALSAAAAPDPRAVLVAWQTGLLLTAAALLLASRSAARAPARLVRAVVAAPGQGPARARVEAVQAVLAQALRDPDLRITVADPAGGHLDAPAGAHVVQVAGAAVIAVESSSALLRDAAVVRSLDEVLAQAARSFELAEARERHLDTLRGARRRLVLATDLERQRLAHRLETDVLPHLTDAAAALGRLPGPDQDGALAIAVEAVGGARADIQALLRGVPPHDLGHGRVVDAVTRAAAALPLRVDVEVQGEVAGPAEVEAALFYVCSEALTNAVKHAATGPRADPPTVRVRLAADPDGRNLGVTVTDDGRGGADPAGHGLAGLRERVLALGGMWSLDSPPGRGTVVTARLPVPSG